MYIVSTPAYQNAFVQYLRKGTPIEVSIKASQESKDSPYYVWETVGDDKVREPHAARDGQVFSWESSPRPGEELGCRCSAIPIPKDRPIALEESKLRVGIYFPDGSSLMRINGSRAWRNNNPGNIRSGSFANNHGAIGKAGGFAVFPDETTGGQASIALLKTSTYANLTIDQAIDRRSPSSENDTSHLQETIRRMGGFTGQETIGLLDDIQISRLAEAIKRTEGWIPGSITRTEPPQ
jgi:hypothetical protein